jgi:hypothetical protein
MATQTNPRIKCHSCSKEIIHRRFFSHLHSQHHSDFWTPSNKKRVEKAIADHIVKEIFLEVKGYDVPFYFSPFSQRLYNKSITAKNDIQKHKEEKAQYFSLLTSLLSSTPAEKKTVTQVSEVTPAQKDELLALKKLLAIMAKELMLERREAAEKQHTIDTYRAKLVENGMTEEEVDDLEPLCDDEPEVFDYKKDILTKKHAQYVKSFDLSNSDEILQAKYSVSSVEPVVRPKQPDTPSPASLPDLPHTIPDDIPQQASSPETSYTSPTEAPTALPLQEPFLEPPSSAEPSSEPSHQQQPSEQQLLLPSSPEQPGLTRPLIKKQPKKATSAAELAAPAQVVEPVAAPPQPLPSLVKKPVKQMTSPSYQQFVYREPVPQYPKILQTSRRM